MVSVDGLLWRLRAAPASAAGRCRWLLLLLAAVHGLDLATQRPDEAVHKKINIL
jgi:hypothetical protein